MIYPRCHLDSSPVSSRQTSLPVSFPSSVPQLSVLITSPPPDMLNPEEVQITQHAPRERSSHRAAGSWWLDFDMHRITCSYQVNISTHSCCMSSLPGLRNVSQVSVHVTSVHGLPVYYCLSIGFSSFKVLNRLISYPAQYWVYEWLENRLTFILVQPDASVGCESHINHRTANACSSAA